MMNDDMALVREYAARQSEQAFETLVSRNVSLVHSAALRQLRDPHLAEEITQTVFIILARKAGSLNPKTILPGWLYRTTRYVAAAALKIQRRREHREQEAQMQAVIQEAQTDPAWEQFSPLLDEAMANLRDKDRDAIVLRYFQNRSLRDVGAVLGVDEYAAQKQVARALEKLHAFFTKRGVRSTAEIIAGAISANSVQTAPALLAKSVTAVAIAKGATASISTLTLIKGALKIMAWTKIKTAVVVGVGVLLVGGSTWVVPQWIKEWLEARTSFQVEGTLDYTVNGKPGAQNTFIAYVKSDKWLIRFPIQTNGIEYVEDAFDGVNTFSYMQLQRETIPSNS
jgi:RNA polymerase sigma factor (sigma-70 family)